jgi:hypothetical protein
METDMTVIKTDRILLLFVISLAVICCLLAAICAPGSNRNPRYHIRNGYYMVGIYDQSYGLGTVGDAQLVAVDLRSDDRRERLVAIISRRYGGLSSIEFIDSTTIAISISRGREIIEYDLSSNEVPIWRQ